MNRNYNKNQPKYNWGTGWTKKGVTEKQAGMIEQLSEKTGIALAGDFQKLTRGQASALIDILKNRSYNGADAHFVKWLAQDTGGKIQAA